MKRFYQSVSVQQAAAGYNVFLDKRAVRSPLKHEVILPSHALAEAVANEWDAAGHNDTDIDPSLMPIFSMAVTVADRVDGQENTLRDELVRYGGTDVICYRAGTDTDDIYAHQKEHWDSWCQWAETELGVGLILTEGLMPVNQPDKVRHVLAELVSGINGWQLGCGYRAITLGGSFVLGYAFLQRKLSADSLFDLCFLDELYQNKKWGLDEEAALRHTNIRSELKDLESILSML